MNRVINIKGVTLVELLIAITIFSVVMIIATSMIIQSFNTFNRSVDTVSTKQLAEVMLVDITNNLREITSFKGEANEVWNFTTEDNGSDVNLKIIYSDKELKISIDNKIIRNINNVENFNIERSANRFIIYLEVEDEEGEIIIKRKEVLSRNL